MTVGKADLVEFESLDYYLLIITSILSSFLLLSLLVVIFIITRRQSQILYLPTADKAEFLLLLKFFQLQFFFHLMTNND